MVGRWRWTGYQAVVVELSENPLLIQGFALGDRLPHKQGHNLQNFVKCTYENVTNSFVNYL